VSDDGAEGLPHYVPRFQDSGSERVQNRRSRAATEPPPKDAVAGIRVEPLLDLTRLRGTANSKDRRAPTARSRQLRKRRYAEFLP